MNFAQLTASLNLNIQNFSQGLRTASAQASSFAATLSGQVNNGLVAPAKKAKFEFKDVARIVQGIIISKVFYSGLSAIRACTDAVWEFTKQLEYAQIAYSNLFGDTSLSEEFINVLKDFAALTPFSFTESEKAAKRLLAYGVEYKNVMYVMQGVLAAATMQGDSSKIEPISRALGQIYTKGRLMNEEMRQLAEHGIPAYEILQEKLGLTQKQLQNLGKTSIPANVAINALVDGIQERFGNVLDASAKTISGIINNIQDNATMLMSGLMTPVTTFFKSALSEIGTYLFNLRDIYENYGAGGVFEAIVPKEYQGIMRQFIANLKSLREAVAKLVVAVGGALKPVLASIVTLANALLPIINAVIHELANALYAVTSNATAMKVMTGVLTAAAAAWVIYKVRALGALVVTGVVKLISLALSGLAAAMTLIVAHPLWVLLGGAAALLVGLSGGFTDLGEKIRNVFKDMTKLNGIDPDDLLLPSQKDRVSDLDKFNQRLDTTADNMDDLADSTGNANKAAKSLLSFDEVFRLKDPSEDDDSISDAWDELLNSLDFSGQSYVPEVPDFSQYALDFTNGLIAALRDKFVSAGIGAVIGGLLGLALGGVGGAKFGAAIGGFVGWFWDEIANQIGLTDLGKIGLPIATGLGATIGALAGGPLGAVIGAAIGALVGWITDRLTYGFETGDFSGASIPLGLGLGAAIGFIAGGPAGAAIGAAIGALVGWIGKLFIEGFTKGEWDPDLLGTLLGGGIGAAIGLIFGGPAGAAIGAAIGAGVGWMVGKVIEEWDAVKEAFTAPFKEFGTIIAEGWQTLKDWFANASQGESWGEIGKNIIVGIIAGIVGAIATVFLAIKAFFDAVVESLRVIFGIHSPAKEMEPFGGYIIAGILEGFKNGIGEFFTTIGEFGAKVISTVADWFSGIYDGITGWVNDTATSLSNWSTNTYTTIQTWATNVGTKISNWRTTAYTTISSWVSDTANKFTNWKTTNYNKIAEWVSDTWTKFTTWKTNTYTTISGWVTDTKAKFTNWKSETYSKVTGWVTDTEGKFTTWKNNVTNTISTWWTNVSGYFNKFTSFSFSSWASTSLSAISSWASNVYSAISSKIGAAISTVSSFLNLGTGSGTSSGGTTTTSSGSSGSSGKFGHATGGVFNREHIARFAEGNKAEAIIPLENASAMQPFVDAVANGLTNSLAPMLVQLNGSSQQNNLQPLYVGTLIADDRGLKQLYKKFELIQVQENARRGITV